MHSNSLTPEVRPDKNGNMVTRWVRRLKGPRNAVDAIPAPSVTTNLSSDEQERMHLIAAFVDDNKAVHGDAEKNRLRGKLESFSVDSLTAINEFETEEEIPYFIPDMILREGASEKQTLEAMKYRDCFIRYPEADVVHSFLKGIAHYPEFNDNDLLSLAGTRLTQARAMCRVTDTLFHWVDNSPLCWSEDEDYRYITDDDLVQFILKYAERGDELAGYIEDRQTVDTGLLRQMLDNGTVLNDGEL